MSTNKFRFICLAVFVFACLPACGVAVRREQANTVSPVPQPNPPTPVVDYANVIDTATEQRLNNILMNLSENKQANVEMGVVTVRTTGGQDIFDYSLAIMRGWGIGSSEKGGLLLVVAVDDRKYFTQVSRHLEGDITDGMVGQIQRERLVPRFKQQQYSEGIAGTVEAYIATLAEKRGFSVEGIDRRLAYEESQPRERERKRSSPLFSKGSLTIFIIIIVIFFLLSSRGGGGNGCGCLNLLLLNSLLSGGSRGGWGSSGWGGGGFGGSSGWGGGGGGGWGGFSGGGGDAGGGGAGGSW